MPVSSGAVAGRTGYGLAVPPDRISVGAVIRIVDGPFSEAPCRTPGRLASPLTDVWTAVTVSVSSVLDETTLEHLMTGQLPDHVRQLAGMGAAAPVALARVHPALVVSSALSSARFGCAHDRVWPSSGPSSEPSDPVQG